MKIRKMSRKDVVTITEMESKNVTFPLSMHEINSYRNSESVSSYVVDEGDDIVGYIFASLKGGDKFLIHRIVVSSKYRRSGIASELLRKFQHKVMECFIEESNLSGQLFLKDKQFKAVQTIKDYFVSQDAYLMRYVPN